jgi:hypothetical protein
MYSNVRTLAAEALQMALRNDSMVFQKLAELANAYQDYLNTLPYSQRDIKLSIVTPYGMLLISRSSIPGMLRRVVSTRSFDAQTFYVLQHLSGGGF